MQSKRNNRGFTLAETLIVVAILIILAALAFISVITQQRNMAKLKYDGYAKEIFIAAQNHLTMAESQGYLGLETEKFGIPDPNEPGVYYFVVNVSGATGAVTFGDGTVLDLMLPLAAVDDTVRQGGQYIIRYHKDSAQVLDVFYWSANASPARFSLTYEDEDYADFLSKRGNKDALKSYGDGKAVVGYYGGVEAAGLTHGEALKAPNILIRNGETLTVEVRNPNTGITGATLKLVIEGLSSGKTKVLNLAADSSLITVTLDDISDDSTRFRSLFPGFIPGENLRIQAVAQNNSELTNVAYSAKKTTNSLFADGTDAETAKIAFFRHLENLDNNESGLSYNGDDVMITKAEQITDLSWSTGLGYDYAPVSPGYALDYDGMHKSISDLVIGAADGNRCAGVFGKLAGELDYSGNPIKGSVRDLELIDLNVSVSGGAAVGTLAGTTEEIAVSNVLARNSGKDKTATVTGSGSVGGLIGAVDGGTVEKCAAALVVKSTGGDAGGLIGSVDGGSVSGCYSGGHTTGGEYKDADGNALYNVTASGSAGGLVGSFSGSSAVIENSYSTCSATGATVGGLVGSAASGSIENCYAAGLVSGTTEGAFAGSLSAGASYCRYYRIVNERDAEGGSNGSKGYTYLSAVSGSDPAGITAFDADASTYDGFVGAPDDWAKAHPYDTRGSYPLKSMARLLYPDTLAQDAEGKYTDFVAEHYGDWPTPETWVVNR